MKHSYISTAYLGIMASAVLAANKGGGSAPPPPADESKVEIGGFVFEKVELPPTTRGGAIRGGEPTELAKKLAAVPVGLSFLEAVTVADTITDPTEREKAFKDAAKRLTNKISGAIRRHRGEKSGANKAHNFALRTVTGGVRVYRTADSTAEELAAEAAKAAPAVPATGTAVPPPPPPPAS